MQLDPLLVKLPSRRKDQGLETFPQAWGALPVKRGEDREGDTCNTASPLWKLPPLQVGTEDLSLGPCMW